MNKSIPSTVLGFLSVGIPAEAVSSLWQLGTAVLSFFVLRWLERQKTKNQ